MAWPELLAGMDAGVVGRLGIPTTYTPATGTPVTAVQGIFDASYVRVDAGQAGVQSSSPAVFYRLVDLPIANIDEDDPVITVNGVDYDVTEYQKDGQGGVRLFLHRRD